MKYLYILAFTALALSVILMGYLGTMMFYPFKPVSLKEPIEILNEQIRPGDILRYKIEYCKHYDFPGYVAVELIDGEIHFFAPIETDIDPGCGEFISNRIKIPEYITPGEYKIKITIFHRINLLREVKQNFYSDFFIIQPKDLSTPPPIANPSR